MSMRNRGFESPFGSFYALRALSRLIRALPGSKVGHKSVLVGKWVIRALFWVMRDFPYIGQKSGQKISTHSTVGS